MAKDCCGCIPIKWGCVVIGAFYIITIDSTFLLYEGRTWRWGWGYVWNDDDEERRNTETVMAISHFLNFLQGVLGVTVIVAALLEVSWMLKVCSVALLIGIPITTLFDLYYFIWLNSWCLMFVYVVLTFYFAYVLWSYAVEIENAIADGVPPGMYPMHPGPAIPGPPGAYQNPGSPGVFQNPGPPGAYRNPGPPGAYRNPGPPGAYQNPGPPGAYQNPGPPGAYQNPGPPSAPPAYSKTPPSA